MFKKVFPILFVLIFGLSACQPATQNQGSSENPRELTIMTHDSFSISAELVSKYEADHQVKLTFIQGGDAGSALNRLVLTSGENKTPEADVFYGLDNTFLSRGLEQDLFEPYQAENLDAIPEDFKLDPENRVTPIDFGDVCINYDKAWFADNNLELPSSLKDLANPIYRNLLVVENPATSSPGLSFLMATIAEFGECVYLDFGQSLSDNGLTVVSDWETAYYTNFSGSSGKGPQPMVVSYASSPAAELIYAETELTESPTASLVAPACAGVKLNLPAFSKTRRTVIWQKTSSTSCSVLIFRKICPCKCSSIRFCQKRPCPKALCLPVKFLKALPHSIQA